MSNDIEDMKVKAAFLRTEAKRLAEEGAELAAKARKAEREARKTEERHRRAALKQRLGEEEGALDNPKFDMCYGIALDLAEQADGSDSSIEYYFTAIVPLIR